VPLNDKVGRPIQESLLALLIFDEKHGSVVARSLSPEEFDGDYADIARRVGNYWSTYNKPPKMQVDDLFADIFTERTGRDQTYGDLFVSLMRLHEEGLNAEFLLDTIARFTRFQSLKRVLISSAELARAKGEDSLEEIDTALDNYRRLQIDRSSGEMLSLLDFEPILKHLQERSVEFNTGIKELDRNYIAPARGQLFLLLGTTGIGKSWGLIHLANRALIRRKRVLYITLEMDAAAVGARFYQALMAVSTRQSESLTTRFVFDEGQFAGFEQEQIKSDFLLFDEDTAHVELAVRVRNFEWMFKNLRIKRFAPGELTPELIEAVVDTEAASSGFIPDMIVVDYVGIMKVDPNNMRITLGHAGVGLRRIAVQRNIAMVTAQQASRVGISEQKAGREVDIEHTAEDITLINTSDTAVTMSQTKMEGELGLMRLLVAKMRGGKGRFTTLVTQDYTRGQFVVESHPLPSRYSKVLKEFNEELAREQESDDKEDSS
jgi:KaiC/GvpD/RAD55 family RecA-like ATPase